MMKRFRVAILLGAISVLLLAGFLGLNWFDNTKESGMGITAKSVILDIADNWGDDRFLGIRSIDFWYEGVKIDNPETNFSASATSFYDFNYAPAHAFSTDLDKIGYSSGESWLADADVVTNQRLVCRFSTSTTFDEIRVNNFHSAGGSTTTPRGAKTVVIHTSTDAIYSTVYGAAISNSTEIYNGTFDEHAAVDAEDEQILALDLPVVITADATLPTLRLSDYGAYAYTGDIVGWGVVPALEVESQAGQFTIEVDSTLPDLECEATMSPTGIRTGDYFNDYTINLPTLEVEGDFGHHASLDAKLPDLESTGRTGSNAEGNLPELELTANCLVGQVATLDKKLPFPTLAASTGARLSKKLPLITINAEASTPTKLRLNKVLPTVGIEATITGATGSLDKIIAFPKITATGSQDVTGNLDAKIPTIKISAEALSGSICTLDATLPDLRIEAESNSAVIFLDAYLPTVTTGVASGSDYGSASNTISGDRFDGTLLRHERWA